MPETLSRPASRLLATLIATVVGLVLVVPAAALPVAAADGDLSGMSVFLDPGHNAIDDGSLTNQVPNGRGGTKDCQTTGTATDDGYAEHAFNWDVALRVRDELVQRGARVQMSRPDDGSVGPCVDQRAAEANAMRPDVDVSIHADGGPPSGSGFHVNYSAPPLNDSQSGPAMQLATTMRDALIGHGLHPATYIGANGLYGRADLAGLNLAMYPAVLIELGNMRNGAEAAQMQSADGRQRFADAVAAGIVVYLREKKSAG